MVEKFGGNFETFLETLKLRKWKNSENGRPVLRLLITIEMLYYISWNERIRMIETERCKPSNFVVIH